MTDFKDKIWLMEPESYKGFAETRANVMAEPSFMAHMAAYEGKDPKPYAVTNGVAIINFLGPITARDSFFSWLMGGAVLPALTNQMRAADLDPDVSGIVVNFDSPGGPPAGLAEFSNMVRGLETPTVGFCDGMVASAALWIATAMDHMVISKTASVGSIGVIAVLEDVTEAAAQAGVKLTVLRAGKYKALGMRFETLTGEAKAVLQAEIDTLYSVFIDELAGNLGKTPEQVLEMAEGKMFIGEQAVEAGLADKIGFLEDAIALALNNNTETGGTKMADIKTVKAMVKAYPELCAELESSVDMTEYLAAETMAETTRLLGLVAAYFGKESGTLFEAVVASGVTLEQYESVKASIPAPAAPAKSEADTKAAALAKLETDTPAPVGTDTDAGAGPATFEAAWKLIKEELKCDTQKAMSVAAKRYPELHKKITEANK
jgi:signal peptide peptidase SppA